MVAAPALTNFVLNKKEVLCKEEKSENGMVEGLQ